MVLLNSRYIKKLFSKVRGKYYLLKYSSLIMGSSAWLIATELKYGGMVTNVKRQKVSPWDPRTIQQVEAGGMTGGDRMLHHGYAIKYSEFLGPYIRNNEPVVMVEFGILKGTGLAVWCDLFKNGRIIGLDIDLHHIERNRENLLALGAFRHNDYEIYEFDQFLDNQRYLGKILNREKVDICIDDGFHSNKSIITTMKSVVPYLNRKFLYIVEDNDQVHKDIEMEFPDFAVQSFGKLTIIRNQE